jgi:hypothetical protein
MRAVALAIFLVCGCYYLDVEHYNGQYSRAVFRMVAEVVGQFWR